MSAAQDRLIEAQQTYLDMVTADNPYRVVKQWDRANARRELEQLRADVARLTQERDEAQKEMINFDEHHRKVHSAYKQAQTRIKALEKAIHDARFQLRSTADNWHEDCLFLAYDILTNALEGTEQQEKSSC